MKLTKLRFKEGSDILNDQEMKIILGGYDADPWFCASSDGQQTLIGNKAACEEACIPANYGPDCECVSG